MDLCSFGGGFLALLLFATLSLSEILLIDSLLLFSSLLLLSLAVFHYFITGLWTVEITAALPPRLVPLIRCCNKPRAVVFEYLPTAH